MEPILRSKWRNEVLNATKVFSKVAFLDLAGPKFTPGAPAALFAENRYMLWGSDYAAELATFEMLTWLKQSHLYMHADGMPYYADIRSIVQHTYSRGLVTERVLQDMWMDIARFLRPDDANPKFKPLNNASEIAEAVSARSKALRVRRETAKDHTEEYCRALKNINSLTRSRAVTMSRSTAPARSRSTEVVARNNKLSIE